MLKEIEFAFEHVPLCAGGHGALFLSGIFERIAVVSQPLFDLVVAWVIEHENPRGPTRYGSHIF
jgi:hypothetical protein